MRQGITIVRTIVILLSDKNMMENQTVENGIKRNLCRYCIGQLFTQFLL